MRCALEAVALSAINEAKIKAKEQAKLYPNTLSVIENIISPLLEKNIKKGYKPSARLEFGYTNYYSDKDKIAPLVDEGIKRAYADGTPSKVPNYDMIFSLKMLIEELKKYCYSVTVTETTYRRRGYGQSHALELEIEPSPQCIK